MIKWLLGTPPEVGSVWSFRAENPFERFSVTVIDVREGWVKYESRTRIGSDTLSIRSFRASYKENKS